MGLIVVLSGPTIHNNYDMRSEVLFMIYSTNVRYPRYQSKEKEYS